MLAEYGLRGRHIVLGRMALRDVAVDLVGADLQEAPMAVTPRGLEQDERADHVGPDERAGLLDAAIDVRLRREVHDRVGLRREAVDEVGIGDVTAHEREARSPSTIARLARFPHRSACRARHPYRLRAARGRGG